MRLRDDDDQCVFRSGLRAWLRAHVPAQRPGDPRHDPGSEELRAWSKSLCAAGYAGLTWPVAHGGRGLSPVYQAIYAEESTLAGAPDHVNVIGLNMVGPTIIAAGTDEQRARYLSR